MRGAVQTGIEQIEVREVGEPTGDASTALVRVRASGICGSDLHPYHGRSAPRQYPEGHEVSGEILSLPSSYDGPLRPGDLVALDTICLGLACGKCAHCLAGRPYHCGPRLKTPYGSGGFAELIRRRTVGLFPLPTNMTLEQGALVEPLAIGVHAVRYGGMPVGSTVAVVGAGTIGLMTLLASRALGASAVHVVARHPHQAELAKKLGATSVTMADASGASAHVLEQTDGIGADAVFETVGGHTDSVNLCWNLARHQGLVVILGIFPEPVPVNLLKPSDWELKVVFPECYSTVDGRNDYDVAIEMIADGHAPVEKLVTHRFALENAREAFRVAADKSTGSVKVHFVM
ncbi:MAG TPA: zinc-binding dehydrogenase [Chloroflexota bacterium]|nr:zinc-binding dehydrogenase [Chloroflexota bacterium]